MTEEEFEELIKPSSLEFFRDHLEDDPEKVSLKYYNEPLPIRAISEQIHCYKKAINKIPLLAKRGILFERVALEQSSCESAAKYKSSLLHGESIIDLTGGLGIDDIFISQNFKQLFYCEQDVLRAKLFEYNIKHLGISNISILCGDSVDTLSSFPDKYFSWIYADPSRRDGSKRLVGLQNCSPDIISNMDLLVRKAKNILIKASPALDLEEVRKQIKFLKEYIVVSVDNECKEILLLISDNEINEREISDHTNDNCSNDDDKLIVRAILINSKTGETKQYSLPYCQKRIQRNAVAKTPQKYFYEPDAAIIKSRLTEVLLREHPLLFINANVDYLKSEELISDFPGRVFQIVKVMSYKKQTLKEYLNELGIDKANIARRDFPDTPEIIRNYLKLKDGGQYYLFFTKDINNKLIVIISLKVKL
jgi:predicted RNA methylase